MRQRVFAFQPREDDRFFIPANSFLRAVFVPKPDIAQEKGGCVVTHEELRRTLDREISEYIHLRAKQQHNTYRRRLGAAPCPTVVTRDECPKPDCQFQHIRPEEETTGWFNARTRPSCASLGLMSPPFFYRALLGYFYGVACLLSITSDTLLPYPYPYYIATRDPSTFDSHYPPCRVPHSIDSDSSLLGNPSFEFDQLPPRVSLSACCHWLKLRKLLTLCEQALGWCPLLYSAPPVTKSSDLSQHLISGTPLNQQKALEFCRNGSGKRVTSSYSGRLSTPARPFEYDGAFIPSWLPICTMTYDFDFERAEKYVPRT
ncbi:hypothetical protein BDM02DRAFT_3264649 [Thelephora ganbajun]|uniref:Uncharacterized protein n=1 Tax=Thelephora ganbajun TaxID=370292 RepID=A0ACB6YWR2_THEGA|nr:hypothetical protein BDM02DRAFT_3264649 [Thelephora ganbajun]